MDQQELIKQLNSISSLYHEKLKEMESKYPQLERNDARLTFFHKCIKYMIIFSILSENIRDFHIE